MWVATRDNIVGDIEINKLLSLSPALGQIMLYVDGMNGLISHNETVQWLYTLAGSKVRNMDINLHQNIH